MLGGQRSNKKIALNFLVMTMYALSCAIITSLSFSSPAGVAKLVDAADSKSAGLTSVPVRFRLPAPLTYFEHVQACPKKFKNQRKPALLKALRVFSCLSLSNLFQPKPTKMLAHLLAQFCLVSAYYSLQKKGVYGTHRHCNS